MHFDKKIGESVKEVENVIEKGKVVVDEEAEAISASKQYQLDRKYPSIEEQLDMIWHAIDNDSLDKTSDFYTVIKTVKESVPKGSEIQ